MSAHGLQTFADVASFLRQHEVGRRAHIETPFGRRLIYYADLTATGRYLHFIEAWIRRVRPFYANTHTAVSSTGRVVTGLREEAREVIRRSVNAAQHDEVIFVGAGATSAVNLLVGLLGFNVSEPLERSYGFSQQIPEQERPIVFVGPYEHHSNELPWVDSIADVIEIGLDADGGIDLAELEQQLARYADRATKIGSFSAASNVTGVLSDVSAISRMLHRAGAYAVFDYAAAAPYVPIDMHPSDPDESIDALFMSTHKFLGGPQASGILVVNRELFRTRTPVRPGGGTVDFVSGPSRALVDYVARLDEREEGGTPAIMGDLRAGTAFLVKEMIGPERMRDHEIAIARAAVQRLAAHPRIDVLGPTDAPRLAIISFVVSNIHHDLVAALLDHLFGIQNRAGCSCAGPYGHRLLDVDLATSERYRQLSARGIHGLKPGWVRLSLPYYASQEDLEFVLSAVEFVADHGVDFAPLYEFGWRDGVWRHRTRPQPDVPPLELTVEALQEAAQSFAAGDHEAPMSEHQLVAEREQYFAEARQLAAELAERWKRDPPEWNTPTGIEEIDRLVWFRYVYCCAIELDECEPSSPSLPTTAPESR